MTSSQNNALGSSTEHERDRDLGVEQFVVFPPNPVALLDAAS